MRCQCAKWQVTLFDSDARFRCRMSALFPGYKQVDAFGPDEDYESHDGEVEEEVEYVTLDLGTVEPTLVPSSSSYRLIVS